MPLISRITAYVLARMYPLVIGRYSAAVGVAVSAADIPAVPGMGCGDVTDHCLCIVLSPLPPFEGTAPLRDRWGFFWGAFPEPSSMNTTWPIIWG